MDSLEYLFGLEKLGIKFGLENIRALCESLGQPQNAYRSIIIAGTNGKGSVTAMVEQALRAAGWRAARYTSPHLMRLEERFVIDGREVPTAVLREGAALVRSRTESLLADGRLATSPTFFESTTAIAFELFRRAGVEIAVLEVGMGGRYDATNVVTPMAAAITSVDLDHERYLGTTIAAIAAEKAGVIKPGISVVVGETKPDAVDVIAEVCRAQDARLVRAGDAVTTAVVQSQGRIIIELATLRRQYGRIRLALRGRHQVGNSIAAVRLLEELESAGIRVGREPIISGLEDVVWHGRLDLVEMDDGHQVLFDAAHNPAGASALAAYLRDNYPDGLPVIFAAMADKDATGMLGALLQSATRFIMTRPQNPRAADPAALARLAASLQPGVPVEVIPSAREALSVAHSSSRVTCVTGSLFLVGELLGEISRKGPTSAARM